METRTTRKTFIKIIFLFALNYLFVIINLRTLHIKYIMNIQSPYENVFINIKQLSSSVSVLFFTDENKNTINIPENTTMYIYESDKPTILESYLERYFLSFTDNYELKIKEKVIYLTNKRSWELHRFSGLCF